MEKEKIKQAAKEYAKSNAWCPEESCADSMKDMEESFANAFMDGARWRVNAAWHDMEKEVPQVYGEYENKIAPSIPCLVRGYLSTGYGYGVRYWNVDYEVWDDEEADDFECEADKIEEWAYLDDFLPERKEAEP